MAFFSRIANYYLFYYFIAIPHGGTENRDGNVFVAAGVVQTKGPTKSSISFFFRKKKISAREENGHFPCDSAIKQGESKNEESNVNIGHRSVLFTQCSCHIFFYVI